MKKLAFRKNLPLIITGLVALGVVSVAAYVHETQPQTKAGTITPNPSSSPSAKNGGTPGAGTAGVSGAATTSTPSNTPTSTDPRYNSSTLAAPIQTFNKSHTAISLSQTDSSKPDYPSLDSTCQSVIGATCEIHATMGSSDILVAGPATISDANNGVDLPWNAKDKGLTAGTWTISALAKNGGQSSSSTSSYTLTVNP